MIFYHCLVLEIDLILLYISENCHWKILIIQQQEDTGTDKIIHIPAE